MRNRLGCGAIKLLVARATGGSVPGLRVVFPFVLLLTIALPFNIAAAEQRPPAHWDGVRLTGYPDPPPPFRLERTFPELTIPQAIAAGSFPSGGWMWVAAHQPGSKGPGRVYRFPDSQQVSDPELLLERPEMIYGLAFHPQFAENGYLFVGCNGRSGELDATATRVLRLTLDVNPPFACDPESAIVIIEWPSNGHNGGDLAFGPDGMLYVSAGDGTSDSDPDLAGQDLSTITGSIIRIDVDRPTEPQLYSVPADNPFVDTPGARPEIWAYGLRNPWRLTFDAQNGRLWVGNNGQDLWETAHLVRRGENYGWSVMEGGHPFQLHRPRGPTPLVPPTIEHPHSEARSLTGGVVYYGQDHPELRGAYLYGDYSTGTVWAARYDGQRVTDNPRLARSTLQITGFGVDSRGEPVVVDHGGGLYRLMPQPPNQSAPPFPKRLSETGLFLSTAEAEPHPDLFLYDVNATLWSDGAAKERFIATPNRQPIEFSEKGAWKFPAGTTLVKTFSLDIAQGDQSRPRRIETRLLVLQDGQWNGYTYAWNEDQTDAVLVAAAGLDKPFPVAAGPAGAAVQQTWRFPSRTECAVCHTRAAGFVLGVNTAQLNRPHPTDAAENQLTLLARAALLQFAPTAKDAGRQDPTNKQPRQDDLAAAPAELPKHPDQYPRLTDPQDASQPLEERVRSYLHANCAQCHTNAGGGNSRMELTIKTPLHETSLIDVPPQHDRFGIDDARLIAPGDPDRSLLLHRMARRSTGQMPPLATNVPDVQAIELLRQWIESLPAAPDAPGGQPSE